MARKKRASLKDKGPEALGLTQKKSKGIDVLFGGPPGDTVSSTSPTSPDPDSEEQKQKAESDDSVTVTPEANEAGDTSESKPGEDLMADETVEKLPGGEDEVQLSPPPAPPVSAPEEEVDEFGLPVALDAPPNDLEFAPPPEPEPLMDDQSAADAFDPTLSPFAAPSELPPIDVDDDDLSGMLEEDELSGLAAEVETDSPAVATTPAEDFPPGAADDLAGLAPEPPPADWTATPPPEPVSPTASFPPPAAPGSTSVPGQPGPAPVRPQPEPQPASTPPPPPPILSPARVEGFGGMVAEAAESAPKDLLPADLQYQQDGLNVMALAEHNRVQEDAVKATRVAQYVGRERRENLDMEIERLYNEVAKQLSVNKADAEFALSTLSEAQDIVLEDVRQYDEALYRVAVVKTMLARKRNLQRWSYTWGLFVFFYATIWLAAFLSGFLVTDILRAAMGDASEGLMAIRGAWFSALAGGIGGVIGVFYSLYWHVAMKQDFDRQYVMYYLVQPIMGFILGALIYFILVAGFLILNVSDANAETATALGVVLGFIAGFRQRVVFEMIDRIVQKLLPRSKDQPDSGPVSVVPAGSRETIEPPGG